MRTYLLAAVATAALFSSPASARDGSGYVGLEGGVTFPQSRNGNFTAVFMQSSQSPAAGTAATSGTGRVGTLGAPFTTLPAPIVGNGHTSYKVGMDVDGILGWDFGMFRLEGEVAYKRSRLKSFHVDSAFGNAVAAGLNTTGTSPTGVTGANFV